MSVAQHFKALGAGNGFPGCLGDPTNGLDYDSSNLNDVSIEVAMNIAWNIRSLTFGSLVLNLQGSNGEDGFYFPDYEPKSLATHRQQIESIGRYRVDIIGNELYSAQITNGGVLDIGGVKKYFHGIFLRHEVAVNTQQDIVTTYSSRPPFTASQVSDLNYTNYEAIFTGEPGTSGYGHNLDRYDNSEFTQSVVIMGGIEFLKTVRKQATSYVSVGGTPDYDYPTEFPAPTTASFEFFTY